MRATNDSAGTSNCGRGARLAPRHARWRVAAAAVILAAGSVCAAACAALVGIPDRDLDVESVDGAVAEGATTEAAPGCSGNPRECTDPRCATHVCAPALPPGAAGWRGPVAVAEGAGSTSPSCAGDFPVPAYQGKGALDAASGCACACGAPSGVACLTTTRLYNNGSCNGTPCDQATAPVGTCASLSASSCQNYNVIGPYPEGGACSPVADAPAMQPPTWGVAAAACAPSSVLVRGACAASEVCAPRPAAPFGAKLCVFSPGDVSCPAGAYSARRVLYGGADDTRTCRCRCAPPTGVACRGGSITLWNSTTTCSGAADQSDNFPRPTCTNTPNTEDSFRTTGVVPEGGSCAPIAEVDGGLAPREPTTICCLP